MNCSKPLYVKICADPLGARAHNPASASRNLESGAIPPVRFRCRVATFVSAASPRAKPTSSVTARATCTRNIVTARRCGACARSGVPATIAVHPGAGFHARAFHVQVVQPCRRSFQLVLCYVFCPSRDKKPLTRSVAPLAIRRCFSTASKKKARSALGFVLNAEKAYSWGSPLVKSSSPPLRTIALIHGLPERCDRVGDQAHPGPRVVLAPPTSAR